MKKISRILSIVLVLAITLSCICAGAFAETSNAFSQYGEIDENGNGGLLVFGDSFSRGCAACPDGAGSPTDYYEDFRYRNVTGSFPCLLAQDFNCSMPDAFTFDAVGADGRPANYWPVCYLGQSLHSTMKWLGIDDGWEDGIDEWRNYYYEFFAENFGGKENCRTNLIDTIGKASVIVVEQGLSDVFFRIFYTIRGEDVGEIVENMIADMYEGYTHWQEEFPHFISFLREHNKDAQIVIVGSCNPLEGMRISDDSVVPVGNVVSAISAAMNQNYNKWMQTYRCTDKNISFVDITNVETPTNTYNMSIQDPKIIDGFMASVHPTPAGYAFIERQILAALPEEELDPVCPLEPIVNILNNDIKLDLGRFTHVNYVLLDGKTAKYSMTNEDNPFELTVHCSKRTAKNLTIAVVQEDGKIAIYTYQLSYKNGEYSAFRIYSTNNTVQTATTLVSNIFSIGSSILRAFAGLFAKK